MNAIQNKNYRRVSFTRTLCLITAIFQMVFMTKANATHGVVLGRTNQLNLWVNMEEPRLTNFGRRLDTVIFTSYVYTPPSPDIPLGHRGTFTVKYRYAIEYNNLTGPAIMVSHNEVQEWVVGTYAIKTVSISLPSDVVNNILRYGIRTHRIQILPDPSYGISGTNPIIDFPVIRQRRLSDLNGDGDSDIVLRNNNGMVHHWMLEDGIRISSGNVYPSAVDTKWKIVDIEDMDKDSDGDLIWIHENGALVYWVQENGVRTSGKTITNSVGDPAAAGTGWNFVDVEDLDGDGDGDYLWRHTDGRVKYWLVENGTVVKSADLFSAAAAKAGITSAEMTAEYKSWKIVDVEDVYLDGHADIVWRDTDSASGRVIISVVKNGDHLLELLVSPNAVESAWKIVDVADMNGDAEADIIWRHDNGTMHSWILEDGIRQSGVDMWPGFLLDKDWVVQSVVDFNKNGHGDILMRHTNGQVHGWKCLNGVRQSGFNVATPATGLDWTINRHR